jgi:plastocyanin
MSNATKIIIAIVVVVVIALGAMLLTNKSDNTTGTTNTPSNSDTSDDTELSEEAVAATITYTNSGFSPATVTVPAGSAVRIVNESSDTVAPSSDNHPEHTLNPQINFPDILPGQSATMFVTEPGTWGYHNHYKEDHQGTIVVEE